MATILVVDDELGIRGLLSEILGDEGHTVELAENAAQARAARERMRPDLVLLDIWMPDVDGITLLKEWSGAGLLTMPVVMMSGHGTIDTAVEATKHGAMAFLEKPITLQKLLRSVDQALQRNQPRPAPAPVMAPGWPRSDVLLPAGAGNVALGGNGGAPAAHAQHYLTPAYSGPSAEQLFDLDRPLREARDAFERSYFEFHLARENGSMTRVAEKTGLERTHLYRKLKQLGVDIGRAKRPL
ncbi:response regulator [Pseudorhodoferax sp.]|jgi:DNA-binding NtrC family response regulator|uniref:response regulator n=1 Tax=Pseudorhodoferax sp. TaxID=1993553 RepID=UPI001B52937B|nr:response regulator [Pseudorhodoferax sp.]MBP8146068.1 response regulator [Inhella sp.]